MLPAHARLPKQYASWNDFLRAQVRAGKEDKQILDEYVGIRVGEAAYPDTKEGRSKLRRHGVHHLSLAKTSGNGQSIEKQIERAERTAQTAAQKAAEATKKAQSLKAQLPKAS